VTPRAVTHYTQHPGVGHHKKAFLNLTHEGSLPPGAQSLCHRFADYKEERFAAPPRNQARESPDPDQRAFRQLTWASLNVRSIYGREQTLSALMSRHQISVLALQETFERTNDPPEGLPKSTFSKAADNGRRGIMVIVHPALERSAQCATELGGGNPNILWVALDFDDAVYFVASVYLPDNTKHKEADEVVRQLFLDIADIPDGAHVIIMGDWNFDPFRAKGKNKDAFKTMMTHPRMALLQRRDPLDCTRPAANSHIDNIFISKSVVPKTSSKIFYFHTPLHERIPSDHLIVGFKTMGAGRRSRLRTTSFQYDMDPLRDSTGHPISTPWTCSRGDGSFGRLS